MRKILMYSALLMTVLLGCKEEKEKSLSFTLDEPPEGPALSLASPQLTGDTLTLELRATGLSDCYGVATRLTFDPTVLRFDTFMPASGWSQGVVHMSRATDGTLVLGVTEQGATPGNDFTDAPLGTVRFTILKNTTTPLTLLSDKTLVVNGEGTPQSVTPVGGTLEYR